MVISNSPLVPLILCLFFCGMFIVIGGVVYFLAHGYYTGAKAANKAVAEKLGLENLNPDGVYPDIKGTVDGFEVAIDTMYQQYTRYRAGSGSSTGTRAWIRVRAQLTTPPPFQLRSRHQKYDEPIEWPQRATGDPDFDKKFGFFAPEDANLEQILPTAVKQAILSAVTSCVTVATAVELNTGD